MAKKIAPKTIEAALEKATDEQSFLRGVLIDLLGWPIDPNVASVEEIAYDWTKDELKAADLDKKIVEGRIRQLALPDCPWGIFIVEFKNPDVFTSGRGMTVPLRQVLSGLVPRQKRAAHLPSFFREHLLFICTHEYRYFRFVHFKDPGAEFKQPRLASFGWWPGDSVKTVSTYNLPHLEFLDSDATVDEWIDEWTAAFDVERVTKRFYTDYKDIHALFQQELKGVPDGDRAHLASNLLNRLMFVYFLQRKGFLDGGNETYLEDKLSASKGKDIFYTDFLTLLFFEGFAKPREKRTAEAKAKLGEIRYLNGGLFLEHPIEQHARTAGKTVSLPDAVFDKLFTLFGSFSWNLNDKPGGQDNEINPDVLGYIVEKYINQKAFGAYYTRPEITGYLCERTIHRLIVDAVNTPEQSVASAKKAGLPIRSFKTVADLLKKLDPALTTKLLDDVLPNLALLDPACGSGAFLVAAMKTLIDVYAAIFGWIKFNGSPELKHRLKKIEADHASLDYFIKKRIITDNLFGVDIMEEAVEIARLRLFLALAASANTVDELEPLPNIDFNVLRGNSLIGLMHVDAQRVEAKGKTGHLGGLLFAQKTYADVLAERNRQLDSYRHFAAYADDLTSLRDKIAGINAEAQKTLDELLLADFETLGIKYEQATWDDKKGKEGKPIKRPLKIDDIRALHPFHWAFAFDKVMARGGFDAIITNPPWEMVQTDDKEFLQQFESTITKKSLRIEDWVKQLKTMMRDHDMRETWLTYVSSFPHQQQYFKGSPDYVNQVSRDSDGNQIASKINLYKLFTERCFRLLRAGGQCGIVIPSGIYTDLGAKQLRIMLFEGSDIDGLWCFENKLGVFEDVHRSFKIVVLTFARAGKTDQFPAAFMRHDVSELECFPAEGALPIAVDLVKKLSPDSLSLPEFKTPLDVRIAEKMLRFPLLGEVVNGKWRLRLTQELNMTSDSDLFETKPGPDRLPLYEGKMIHQYDCALCVPRYWLKNDAARERLGIKSEAPIAITYRFAHRDVARNTDARSAIGAILPANVFVANTLPTLTADRSNKIPRLQEQLAFLAVFNSFTFDWLIRQKISAHLNMFYVYQMPVPRLQDHDPPFAPLVDRAARLTCTAAEFDGLAAVAKLSPPTHKAGAIDLAERAKLRAELDAMVAHLYRLTEEEFAHILSTFPLVPEATRQAALDEFVRMRDSGEAGIFNPDLAKPAAAAAVDPAKAVKDLIAAGESATVELKSTARWDVKQNQPGKHIERIIVKTVAAFLNAQGGTLVIGVEDDGSVYGLAEDYKLSGGKGRDSFENWLTQTLLKDFGKDAGGLLSTAFYELKAPEADKPGAGDVCVVTVKPSAKPRFVVENGNETFYIRTGNATNALKMSEMLEYYKQRWPETIAGSAK